MERHKRCEKCGGKLSVIIQQQGKDCKLSMSGKSKILKNCNALKLARTMYDKEGTKYSNKKMKSWSLVRKDEN